MLTAGTDHFVCWDARAALTIAFSIACQYPSYAAFVRLFGMLLVSNKGNIIQVCPVLLATFIESGTVVRQKPNICGCLINGRGRLIVRWYEMMWNVTMAEVYLINKATNTNAILVQKDMHSMAVSHTCGRLLQ